jgi:preprotein translocase subunit SecF
VACSLLALLLFGGQAIRSFTATMMFGVVLVGTYTSVFIASPILIYLGVGAGRMTAAEEPGTPPASPETPPTPPTGPHAASKPSPPPTRRARARR